MLILNQDALGANARKRKMMIERDFYHWLKLQAKKQGVAILFNSIESNTVLGFPDLHVIYQGRASLLELKSSKTNTLYYQKTQIAWFHQAHSYEFDVPTLSIINNKEIYLSEFTWNTPLVPSGDRKIAMKLSDLRVLYSCERKNFNLAECIRSIYK